jgi:hypothetical protein
MNASQMITVQMTVSELLVLQSLLARASGAPAPSTPQKAPKAPLEAPGAPKKAKKEKDADAPKKAPNAWILFTQQVRAALTAAGIKAGVEVTQFCGMLKAKNADYSAWTPALVLAEHGSWQKPEKKSASPSLPALVPVASQPVAVPEAEPAKKARKPQSEETKKAAAEKRAATKAKKAAAAAPLPASPRAEEAEVSDEALEFTPWNSFLKNSRGDVISTDYDWVGHYDEKTGKLDRTAAAPADLSLM